MEKGVFHGRIKGSEPVGTWREQAAHVRHSWWGGGGGGKGKGGRSKRSIKLDDGCGGCGAPREWIGVAGVARRTFS